MTDTKTFAKRLTDAWNPRTDSPNNPPEFGKLMKEVCDTGDTKRIEDGIVRELVDAWNRRTNRMKNPVQFGKLMKKLCDEVAPYTNQHSAANSRMNPAAAAKKGGRRKKVAETPAKTENPAAAAKTEE